MSFKNCFVCGKIFWEGSKRVGRPKTSDGIIYRKANAITCSKKCSCIHREKRGFYRHVF